MTPAIRAQIAALSDEDLRKTAKQMVLVARHCIVKDLQDGLKVCREILNVIDVEAICRGIELEKVA